uniref:Uncharacterized protein n=1 Tax=Oryza glumipatula TaxID=40148 RepID=A0A0E0AFC3_9ORYZ
MRRGRRPLLPRRGRTSSSYEENLPSIGSPAEDWAVDKGRFLKSTISSIFRGNIDEPIRSAVRRFELFAHGANDFLRSVEFGGTPGETLEYKSVQGNKQLLFWIQPNNIAERGVQAMLLFVYNDGTASEVGTIIKGLQLFTPHFKSTTENVRKQLTLLPTQDFSWVPQAHSNHWYNIHSIAIEWFRPNPLCCKHHGAKVCGSGNMDEIGLQNVSLEPIIEVSLMCEVSLRGFGECGTIVEGKPSIKEVPHPKVNIIYMPHGSSGDLFPTVESSVVEVINVNEQHCLHTNIALQQMEQIMLPKAIDCFHQNAKARVYQMIWKSKHGGAYLEVVKATMNMTSTRRTIRGAKKAKLLRRMDQRTQRRTVVTCDFICDFLNLWAAHAPVQLQGSILDWIQKEKETDPVAKLEGVFGEIQAVLREDLSSCYRMTSPPAIVNQLNPLFTTQIYALHKSQPQKGFINKNILMSEVVVSAVIGEAVSRVSTFFINKHKRKLNEEDGMERLEMAHIRMEAALEVSSRWPPVTDASLLRWRKKLKHASDECSQVMERCKRRAMEDDEMEQEVRQCAFPKRIAHATRSFLSSFTGQKKVDSLITTSTIQKFERLADGASEFLRFMEFGSIGRRINYMLVDPLTGHLLAGKALRYENSQGNQYYLAAWPMSFAERGLEAGVLLWYQNHERPEENFIFGILLRLAASTNVTGIVARCLELLPPNFKPVAEAAKQELTQVHHRALYCFPFVDSTDPEYSRRTHHSETHQARPNSACCQGHNHHGRYPEPVIKLVVRRYISAWQKPSSSSSSSSSSGHGDRRTPLLQLTAVIGPHAWLEELPPRARSVAVEAIDGREEQAVHTNVRLCEVEELLLPNAIDRLWRHEAADDDDSSSTHEVLWQSGHGVAYLCLKKMGREMAGCRRTHWPYCGIAELSSGAAAETARWLVVAAPAGKQEYGRESAHSAEPSIYESYKAHQPLAHRPKPACHEGQEHHGQSHQMKAI